MSSFPFFSKRISDSSQDSQTNLLREMDVDLFSLDSDSLAMKVIPCLNAPGRLEFADSAMKLFFPVGDVGVQVTKLIGLNRKRRDLFARIVDDVERGIGSNADYRHVLFGEDWPVGVLSSVASQICALRDAPIVLAAPSQGPLIRGTLRVPSDVDDRDRKSVV